MDLRVFPQSLDLEGLQSASTYHRVRCRRSIGNRTDRACELYGQGAVS